MNLGDVNNVIMIFVGLAMTKINLNKTKLKKTKISLILNKLVEAMLKHMDGELIFQLNHFRLLTMLVHLLIRLILNNIYIC